MIRYEERESIRAMSIDDMINEILALRQFRDAVDVERSGEAQEWETLRADVHSMRCEANKFRDIVEKQAKALARTCCDGCRDLNCWRKA